MDTVIGLVGLVALVWAIARGLRRGRVHDQLSRTTPPTPMTSPPQAVKATTAIGTGSVDGLIIGHHLAAGHSGFPGDPLPHGHLGSAADVSFWGSVFDDDGLDDA